MSKPDSGFLPPDVIGELQRAERLSHARQWTDVDACYDNAIILDPSPTSRIAYATSLASRERYHDSICQLTTAIDMASESGNRDALGVIFHNLAAIYRELGDADQARRFQHRAVLHVEDCGSAELLGLANDAWLSKRPELAECLASSCCELEEDDDPSLALAGRAASSVMSGLSEDPRAGIRSIIAVYRQHRFDDDRRMMGIDLMNLSVLFSELGWHSTEINSVRQALRHFEQASAPVSAAKARQVLAMLQRMQSLRAFDPSVN